MKSVFDRRLAAQVACLMFGLVAGHVGGRYGWYDWRAPAWAHLVGILWLIAFTVTVAWLNRWHPFTPEETSEPPRRTSEPPPQASGRRAAGRTSRAGGSTSSRLGSLAVDRVGESSCPTREEAAARAVISRHLVLRDEFLDGVNGPGPGGSWPTQRLYMTFGETDAADYVPRSFEMIEEGTSLVHARALYEAVFEKVAIEVSEKLRAGGVDDASRVRSS